MKHHFAGPIRFQLLHLIQIGLKVEFFFLHMDQQKARFINRKD